MFSSLNPQSIDSLEPIFQKYLKFSFVFFLSSSCVWLRISADTIHRPQNAMVNHQALLYVLIILESRCRGKEHLMLIRMKV